MGPFDALKFMRAYFQSRRSVATPGTLRGTDVRTKEITTALHRPERNGPSFRGRRQIASAHAESGASEA